MNYIKKIWSLFSSKNRLNSIYLYFLVIINVFLEILSIGSIIPILIFFLEDNIELKYPIITNILNLFSFEYQDDTFFIFLLFSILVLFIVKTISLTLQIFLESNLSSRVYYDVRGRLFNKYIFSDIAFHNEKNSGSIITNLTKEIDFLHHAVFHMLNLFSQATLALAIIFGLLIFRPHEFLIIFSIIAIILLIYNFLTSKKLKKISSERQELDQKAVQKIQSGLGGIREIKVFNAEKKFLESFRLVDRSLFEIKKLTQILTNLPKLFLELSVVGAILVILYFLMRSTNETSTIFSTVGVFTLASIKLLPSVNKIYLSYQSFRVCSPSVNLLHDEIEIIKKSTQLENKKVNGMKNKEKIKFLKNIEIKNLFFNYMSGKKIFENAYFSISKFDFIGIKGKSGIGKSTLVDLIIGLQLPNKGGVFVDGVNTNSNMKNWQNKISYVPQEVFLLDDTIKNNILFQFGAKELNDKKFIKVCKDAEIYDTFFNLPKSFETKVGERGSKISSGQRQRIGLARALYREPELLVLDETTSSLDLDTKNKILQTIKKINENVTIIIVSHDNEVLKNCNKVFEIKNNKINQLN